MLRSKLVFWLNCVISTPTREILAERVKLSAVDRTSFFEPGFVSVRRHLV